MKPVFLSVCSFLLVYFLALDDLSAKKKDKKELTMETYIKRTKENQREMNRVYLNGLKNCGNADNNLKQVYKTEIKGLGERFKAVEAMRNKLSKNVTVFTKNTFSEADQFNDSYSLAQKIADDAASGITSGLEKKTNMPKNTPNTPNIPVVPCSQNAILGIKRESVKHKKLTNQMMARARAAAAALKGMATGQGKKSDSLNTLKDSK